MKYLIILMCFISSCSDEPQRWEDALRSYGSYSRSEFISSELTTDDSREYTLRFDGVEFGAVMRTLSDISGVSIVWAANLDSKLVTAIFKDKQLSVILNSLSRRVGANVNQSSNVWYVGELRVEDRATYVGTAPAGDQAEILQGINNLLSEAGRSSIIGGTLIVTDHIDNLRKVTNTLELQRKQSLKRYLAEMHFIKVSVSDILKIGVDINVNNINLFTDISADKLFSALLQADYAKSNAKILLNPIMQLTEGLTGTLNSGREVPIEQKAVTAEGAIQTTGFDIISDGIRLTLSCRRVSKEFYNVAINFEVSSFQDLTVTGRPVKESKNIIQSVLIQDGEVILVSSLHSFEQGEKLGFLNYETSSSDEVVLVFLRVREFRSSTLKIDDVRRIK